LPRQFDPNQNGAAIQPFWNLAADKAAALFDTTQNGLSSVEALARLKRYESSRLAVKRRTDTLTLLVGQFSSPIVLLLIAAAVLSIFLHDSADAAIILAIEIPLGIAIALAQELPTAKIMATDISAAALEVARRNAARLGFTSRIDFVECNLLDTPLHRSPVTSHASHALSAGQSPQFDLIASNPPYIGRHETATLPREVREHEPEEALFGGETGTEIYAPLIAQAATLLKPGGILVLEIGHTSAEHVSRLLESPEWTSVDITNDLAGIPRVASARRST